MREFLKGLELDNDTIDTIMAEYGKKVNGLREENGTLKNEKASLEKKVVADDGTDWKKKFEDLDTKIKKEESEKKEKEENEILEKNISEALGNKKFSSDYVKKGILKDVKAELEKTENKGKGIKEILDTLTKDKEGIFENPNKPADMPPSGNNNNSLSDGAEGFVSIVKEFQR